MGAGGIIIIRNAVVNVASQDVVKEHLTPARSAELEALLAKQCADWTRREFFRVLELIAMAEADC